jgi:hypothetical protein
LVLAAGPAGDDHHPEELGASELYLFAGMLGAVFDPQDRAVPVGQPRAAGHGFVRVRLTGGESDVYDLMALLNREPSRMAVADVSAPVRQHGGPSVAVYGRVHVEAFRWQLPERPR